VPRIECDVCNGTGQDHNEECPYCLGKGYQTEEDQESAAMHDQIEAERFGEYYNQCRLEGLSHWDAKQIATNHMRRN